MTIVKSPGKVRVRRLGAVFAIMAIVGGCTSGSAGPAAPAVGTAAVTASPAVDVVAVPSVAVTADPSVVPLSATSGAVGTTARIEAVPAAYAVGHLAISFARAPGSFSSPVLVTNAHDGTGRLFVVEQGGRIKIISGTTAFATPFLDIHTRVSCCDERGLLGLAFDPAYKTNGRFYVDYTDKSGNTVIALYHVTASNKNRASTTESIVLHIAQPYANHNGGMLAFGKDGYLYIAMGDGGSAGDPGHRAQNKNSLLGKILRIDVNHHTGSLHYAIPLTNPFVGHTGDDRIWSYGLRNPWRFSFDRSTGDLWIGDVGQSRYEEIDRATAASGAGRGRNYGWRTLEGRSCYSPSSGCSTSGKTSPIAVYSHSLGCAVLGGYVYRGTRFTAMTGAYLFGDFCSGRIWALRANGASSQTPSQLADTSFAISSFGEAEDGTLYLTDLASGGVFRIAGTTK
jgi:glucose/arabinose dehydrogenase